MANVGPGQLFDPLRADPRYRGMSLQREIERMVEMMGDSIRRDLRREMDYLLRLPSSSSPFPSLPPPPIRYVAGTSILIGEARPKEDAFAATVEKLKTVDAHVVQRPIADYVEPIVGWRCWKVVNGKLTALGQSTTWEPKKALEAKCVSQKDHPAPVRACQCGVWAFQTLPKLMEAAATYTDKAVVGTVSLWGRMIQCENGWRAQYAYPKELWIVDAENEKIGYTYGVPVRTLAKENNGNQVSG